MWLLRNYLNILLSIGSSPDDDEILRLKKSSLLLDLELMVLLE